MNDNIEITPKTIQRLSVKWKATATATAAAHWRFDSF
jgi:hypothetical protein